MKKKTICALAALAMIAAAPAMARSSGGGGHTHSSGGSHSVAGHTTKNGTYVAPHHATNPNDSKHDNWSSKGNVNPYTGKEGTKDPNR
jgi:ABC-type oligopeptide transport system substrate-binding subunit